MKEFLEYIVKLIVDKPEEVSVIENITENDWINLKLKVAESDMGKVIGREGKIIKAIRQLVRVLAIKENKKVNIELEESEKVQEFPPEPQDQNQKS